MAKKAQERKLNFAEIQILAAIDMPNHKTLQHRGRGGRVGSVSSAFHWRLDGRGFESHYGKLFALEL